MRGFAELANNAKIPTLNNQNISKFTLYDTPLQDKENSKRIVLFSDNPLEEEIYLKQYIELKICNSQSTEIPFDLAKLQGNSILVKDVQRKDEQSQAQGMYEIVS